MVGYGGSSAGSYLADPTSPIPSHRASIVATSTLRVNPPQSTQKVYLKFTLYASCNEHKYKGMLWHTPFGLNIFYFISHEKGFNWVEHRCYVEALPHTTVTLCKYINIQENRHLGDKIMYRHDLEVVSSNPGRGGSWGA